MEFRFANEKDCGLILSFIRQLADYEKMSDQVVATEELLREWIFEKKKAEGWNGHVLTGISPALTSTAPSAQCLWMNGRPTG